MLSEKNSGLQKYSITIRGHRTSYSLEKEFHDELKIIAAQNNEPLARLVTRSDETRGDGVNLSSALRLLVLSKLKVAKNES